MWADIHSAVSEHGLTLIIQKVRSHVDTAQAYRATAHLPEELCGNEVAASLRRQP